MIKKLLTETMGSETLKYYADDIIFSVGEKPLYFFYISEGRIKLISTDGDSKELIHQVSSGEEGIAEYSLFVNEPYAVTAIAMTDCVIIKLPISKFLSLMRKHNEIALYLLNNISNSLHHNFLMAEVQFKRSDLEKIIMVLNHLKKKQSNKTAFSFQVLLTRQNIADLTGLRVETVIRNIKKLEQQKVLKIIDRKIFY